MSEPLHYEPAPAGAADEWRPGFARRAADFEERLAQARAWRWQAGENLWRIQDAVIDGTPTLTATERNLLMIYVKSLNQERLEASDACCWPSMTLVARRLGCDVRTVRRCRARLEKAGWLVRDYNAANRPNGAEAVNLALTVARLDEMEACDAEVRETLSAERAARAESALPPLGNLRPVAPEAAQLAEALVKDVRLGGHGCPPKQSHGNGSSSVPQSARRPEAPAAGAEARAGPTSPEPQPAGRAAGGPRPPDPLPDRRASRGDGSRGSPRESSGSAGARPGGSVTAQMVRQELWMAVQACPALAVAVSRQTLANPAGASIVELAASRNAAMAAADRLLPEPDRNNGTTMGWAWARHGLRALAMLAVAIEDPRVKNRCAYFGAMAKADPMRAPDLRLNLARILREKDQAPGSAAIEAVDQAAGDNHAAWAEISAKLQDLVRAGAWGSWFGRVQCRGLSDQVLTLTTPNSTAAERIRLQFRPSIIEAAAQAGHAVERVVVTVRRSSS